jgi:HlyD family type I secretion membrane fusion protein
MKYVIREYLSSEQNTHLVKFIPSQSNLPLQPQPLTKLESPQPSLAIVNSQQSSNLVRTRPNILPVVQENDFLPPISLWTQLGGLFLAGAVGIAIALAAVTPYKVTVQAQANIRPAGELRLVEAETEGSVIEIRAKENQIVKKGDILAIIDNSRLETRKSQLESNIEQANLQLKQIQAQITSQEHRISAEADRLNRTITSAEAELSRRRREYQDRLITTSAEVTESEANLRSVQAALNAAISKRNRYQIVAHAGALSKNQLEEAQVAVEQQQQAVQAAQARLQSVQAALNPSNAEVAIAKENIAQERATGQSTLANLRQEKEALIQQQIEIQQQQSRDRQELQQIEKDLHQTAIKATADGILFQLNLRNTGQTVVSGEEIAQIAPSNSSLVAKALVPAQEISQVKTGQPSQLRISACPYPDYGTLKGLVSRISPDAIAPKNNANTTSANASVSITQNRGAAFYEVTIEPESLTVGQGNNQCPLQLGMEGKADIISDEETVLKFLLRKARLLTDL